MRWGKWVIQKIGCSSQSFTLLLLRRNQALPWLGPANMLKYKILVFSVLDLSYSSWFLKMGLIRTSSSVLYVVTQKEVVKLICVCQSNWGRTPIKISPTLASAWCYCVEWNGIGGSINDSPSPPSHASPAQVNTRRVLPGQEETHMAEGIITHHCQ